MTDAIGIARFAYCRGYDQEWKLQFFREYDNCFTAIR